MSHKKYVRKLQRVSSDSYTLNIPKDVIKNLGWREKQKIEIIHDGKEQFVTVKDWKK